MKSAPLLLTGFEPFGGDAFNPSTSLVEQIQGTKLPDGTPVHGLSLPVSGPAAWKRLSGVIRKIQPRWIIATGVSSRAEISIESTAWNEDDYRIPDNAGLQPRREPILTRGPDKIESPLAALLLSDLPLTSAEQLPVRLSTDPGRFVCNHLYYRLLHLTRRPTHSAHSRTVFLHLPCSPEMQRSPDDARFFYPVRELAPVVRIILTSILRSSQGQSAGVTGASRRKLAQSPQSLSKQ